MESTTHKDAQLLPSNALKDIRLGVSVSDSPDLARLGLLEAHFRLALGEIARCVLVSGGCLAYGGHLHPDGYTTFLEQELQRYNRRDRPLLICLAWQEHRGLSVDDLKNRQDALGLYGKIVCLGSDGNVTDPYQDRPNEPIPETNSDVFRQSLTAMRHYMAQNTHGRIFIGGRRHGFQGDMPGVLEEALIALDAGQPIYLAGGFGGVTTDISEALGVDDGSWLPKRSDMAMADERLKKGLDKLAENRMSEDWAGLRNGLDDDENRQLAASHRPSEIAALISLGLGRRFQAASA
jgi:hypothetical protein